MHFVRSRCISPRRRPATVCVRLSWHRKAQSLPPPKPEADKWTPAKEWTGPYVTGEKIPRIKASAEKLLRWQDIDPGSDPGSGPGLKKGINFAFTNRKAFQQPGVSLESPGETPTPFYFRTPKKGDYDVPLNLSVKRDYIVELAISKPDTEWGGIRIYLPLDDQYIWLKLDRRDQIGLQGINLPTKATFKPPISSKKLKPTYFRITVQKPDEAHYHVRVATRPHDGPPSQILDLKFKKKKLYPLKDAGAFRGVCLRLESGPNCHILFKSIRCMKLQ